VPRDAQVLHCVLTTLWEECHLDRSGLPRAWAGERSNCSRGSVGSYAVVGQSSRFAWVRGEPPSSKRGPSPVRFLHYTSFRSK
jgi:hypothetical protein